METIVISIGGSVVLSDDITISYFQDLVKIIERLIKQYKIYLIVGGGNIARSYIDLGRTLNFNEKQLDEIGIQITRVNARLLSNIFTTSNKKIPHTTDEAKKMKYPVVIMGGTTPGHSTDMVAAEIADKTNASKIIIATNVDGIYDKDPNRYHDAKQIKEISIKKLIDQHGTDWDSAGKNVVIDGPALKIINKSKIPTFVLNGKKLNQLERAINDQIFNGTKIKI